MDITIGNSDGHFFNQIINNLGSEGIEVLKQPRTSKWSGNLVTVSNLLKPKVGEIIVNHRKRQFGHSKYGVRRIVKGFLDLLTVYMLTGYGHRPQHLLGTLGLGCFGASGCLTLGLSLHWALDRLFDVENPVHLHERAIFYFALVGVIIGIQLLMTGFVAELVTKQTSKDEQIYAVCETIGTANNEERS